MEIEHVLYDRMLLEILLLLKSRLFGITVETYSIVNFDLFQLSDLGLISLRKKLSLVDSLSA